jgi:hypothetical protein
MPEHPAEIPAEGEGGSGRIDLSRIRGGIGGPHEIPPDVFRVSVSQLVNEVFRLRNRMHALESNMLAARIGARFGGVVGGPQELPAEGEGGGGIFGGGGGVIPHEIHEIAELPASRLVAELSALSARFASLEKNISQQLAAINQRLDAKR